MPSRKEIMETIKARFADAREHGQVLAQALKVRADIAVTRRRLRLTFAELGEYVYDEVESGRMVAPGQDPELADYRSRVKGLHAELRQQEAELTVIMEGGPSATRDADTAGGAAEPGEPGPANTMQERTGTGNAADGPAAGSGTPSSSQ